MIPPGGCLAMPEVDISAGLRKSGILGLTSGIRVNLGARYFWIDTTEEWRDPARNANRWKPCSELLLPAPPNEGWR